MSFFKLTIAEDDIEKRTQSYQNLQAILGALLIAITLTITSGFWYLLVQLSSKTALIDEMVRDFIITLPFYLILLICQILEV